MPKWELASFPGLGASRPDSGSDDAAGAWSGYKYVFRVTLWVWYLDLPFTALCFSEAPFSHLENEGDIRILFVSSCEEQDLVLCLENSKCWINISGDDVDDDIDNDDYGELIIAP